jgi:predicted S18 family serine protease
MCLTSACPNFSNILINKRGEFPAMKKAFLLLAFILSFAYAAECSGSIEMGLPAISEGEQKAGEIVVVHMKLVPGEGNAYIGVAPPTDTSLQGSVEAAIAAAERLAGGENECDVLVSIQDNSEYVQGPSGGAAFALMGYSLFTGYPMRGDAAITGGVDENGVVLPVGGLYEKALIARASGKNYFITPLQGIDEKLMLGNLEGIAIYEVQDLEEAADFFFWGILPEEKPLNLTVEPLPELAEYGTGSPEFRQVAEGIMNREGEAVRKVEDQALREYFGERMLQQGELIEKGYYYSAANDAFLAYVLADSLSEIDNPDVEGKKQEIRACIESVDAPAATHENYEWIMGAEARLERAENQLELYGEADPGTQEERYYLVYQLDYALAWCDAAKDMYYFAEKAGGRPLDNETLKAHAEMLINISSNYSEISQSENYWNGMGMYEDGRYAGASYELMYAVAFEKMNADFLYGNVSAEEIAELNRGERDSLWGEVFKAHSYYLMETGDPQGAYAVAIFSGGMERMHAEILQESDSGGIEELPGPGEEKNGTMLMEDEAGAGVECVCPECPGQDACAVAFVLLILPLFIKNLANKDN